MGRVWWVGWLGQHLLPSHMTTGAAKLWCLARDWPAGGGGGGWVCVWGLLGKKPVWLHVHLGDKSHALPLTTRA